MPEIIYRKNTQQLTALIQSKKVCNMNDTELQHLGLELLLRIKLKILKYENLNKLDTLQILTADAWLSKPELIIIAQIVQANPNIKILTDVICINNTDILNENLVNEFAKTWFACNHDFTKDTVQAITYDTLRIALTFCDKNKAYYLEKDITYIKAMLRTYKLITQNSIKSNTKPGIDAGLAHFSMHFILKNIYDRIAISYFYPRQKYNIKRAGKLENEHLDLLRTICRDNNCHSMLSIVLMNAFDDEHQQRRLFKIIAAILKYKWHIDNTHPNHDYAELIILIALTTDLHAEHQLWHPNITKKLMLEFFTKQSHSRLTPNYILTNHRLRTMLEKYDLFSATPKATLTLHHEKIKQHRSINIKLSLMLLFAFSQVEFKSTNIYTENEQGITINNCTGSNSTTKLKIYLASNLHHDSTLIMHELAHVIQMLYLNNFMYKVATSEDEFKLRLNTTINVIDEIQTFCETKSASTKDILKHIYTLPLNTNYDQRTYPAEIHAELTSIAVNHNILFNHLGKACPRTKKWFNHLNETAYKRAYRKTKPAMRYAWPKPSSK